MAERPRRRQDEVEETPPEPTQKKGNRGLLLWGGYILVSTAVVVGLAVLVAQRRRAAWEAPVHAVVDSLQVDTARTADPLLLSPEDSLRTRIQDLQAQVQVHEDSLVRAVDTTQRLQTRLERLQAELDTLRQRDVLLSSEEVVRLSRVFESMQPRKAAPVMLRMDNASVAAILLMIEERTAAKVMAAMPPDRAAGISTLIREQAKEKARRVEKQP